MPSESTLYYGDNLEVLRRQIGDATIDLVYLDPPFVSGKDYAVLFEASRDEIARTSAGAFRDTWRWGMEAESAYEAACRGRSTPARAMRSLGALLGPSDMLAYLSMMAPRLAELRRVLKPSGSLYLHCDPTASHYLKVLADAVFGPRCFRNEIVWRYRRWPAQARRFQRMHDTLLFYTATAGAAHTFHTLYGYERLAESTQRTFGDRKQRADFSSGHRKPSTEDTRTPGPPLSDVWEVGIIAPIGKERTGYPTQKPEALLERVILASTNEADVVLDPFCGSGTTLAVADRLGRRWQGIDASWLAVEAVKRRLAAARYELIGEPATVGDAARLAGEDAVELERWILGRLGARPTPTSACGGATICGEIFFADERDRDHRVVVAVHGSDAGPADVRALRTRVEGEGAAMGALVTVGDPAAATRSEAARSGSHNADGVRLPRLQVLGVRDLLAGGSVAHPGVNVTLRRRWRRKMVA